MKILSWMTVVLFAGKVWGLADPSWFIVFLPFLIEFGLRLIIAIIIKTQTGEQYNAR